MAPAARHAEERDGKGTDRVASRAREALRLPPDTTVPRAQDRINARVGRAGIRERREEMKVALILAAALLLPAAAQAAPTADALKAEKEIRGALAAWVSAANRGDWKEALKVWAPDLIGWYPGMPDDTYAREVERAARAGPPRTTYQVDVHEVMVSGSMAVVRDVWTFSTKNASGPPTVEKVKSFEVWRRQSDGRWKISRWISAPEPKS
jgi:ketosteroid isomerase-like protein